jgi:hypothetical protein
MKRFLSGLVVLGFASSVLVGCSSGEVTEGGAMDKHQEIQKQTEASEGATPKPTEGQGD